MATREQLIQALAAADAAGNTEDANMIANAIKAMYVVGTPKEFSEADRIQAQFDAMPWYGKLGQSIDDMVRLGAAGFTFNYADKAAALGSSLFGADYETELANQRRLTDEARQRAGLAGSVAELGGSIASPVTRAIGAATGAIPRAAGTLGRVLQGGATGAAEGTAMGALSAAGADQDITQGAIEGGASGAVFGAALPAVAQTAGKLLGVFDNVTPRRTTDQMRAAKDAAYDAVDNAGISFSPNTTASVANDIANEARNMRIDPDRRFGVHRNAIRVLEDKILPDMTAGTPISLGRLDQLRQTINRDVSVDPSNKAFGDMFLRHIDNMIENTPQGGLVSGSAGQADDLIRGARDANRRYKANQTVNEAVEKGLDRGQEGQVQLRGILDNPNRRKFFSPDEQAGMRQVVRGTTKQRAADMIGRAGTAGHALGFGAGGLAAGMANPALAAAAVAIPALGYLGRAVARGERRKGINALLDAIDGKAGRVKSRARTVVEDSAGLVGRLATIRDIQDKTKKKRRRRERTD